MDAGKCWRLQAASQALEKIHGRFQAAFRANARVKRFGSARHVLSTNFLRRGGKPLARH